MSAPRLDSFSVAAPSRDGVAVRVTARHAGSAARPSELFVRASSSEGAPWTLFGVRGRLELHETGEAPDGFTLGDGETLEVKLGPVDELWAHVPQEAEGAELLVLQTNVVGAPGVVTVGGPPELEAMADSTTLGGEVSVDVLAALSGGTDPVTVSFSQPEHGSVAAGDDPGVVVYTADEAYTGDDTFEVTVTDAEGREGTAVVTITISGD